MNLTHRLIIPAILGAIALPGAAWAQKPALTESIDEPGRAPYAESLNATANSIAQFSAVPAGKQLVIKYVNCLGVAFTYRDFATVDLQTRVNNTIIEDVFLVPAAPSRNFAYYAVNSATLAYAQSGVKPTIIISPASDLNMQCTLTGYFVTLP